MTVTRARRVIATVLFGISATGFVSCAGGHNTLGTATSTCFLALPEATSTVHSGGTMVGVRSFTPQQFLARLHHGLEHQERQGYAPPFSMPSAQGSASTTTSIPAAVLQRHRRLEREIRFIEAHLRVFGHQKVCAFEFKGTYPPHSVSHSLDPETSGSYAIVILPVKGGEPVVSFVARRLPFSLRHFF